MCKNPEALWVRVLKSIQYSNSDSCKALSPEMLLAAGLESGMEFNFLNRIVDGEWGIGIQYLSMD